MQGSYNYIHETNHFCGVYNFADVLYLQRVIHVMLFPILNVLSLGFISFQSMYAVFCTCFPGMLLRNFPNDFEKVKVSPNIIGINFHLHALY